MAAIAVSGRRLRHLRDALGAVTAMSDMPEGATRRRHPDDRMRSDPEGAGPSLDRGTMDDHIGNVPKPSNRGADQLLLLDDS